MSRVPLAKMFKSNRESITVRPIFPSIADEQSLAAIYLRVVREWSDNVNKRILPTYRASLAQDARPFMADSVSDLEFEIAASENGALSVSASLRGDLEQVLARMDARELKKFLVNVKYATGVDLSTHISGLTHAETLADALARNVGLIRNVSDETRQRIAQIVFDGLQRRIPTRTLAREINKVVGMSRARSLRIASDQTVKLSSTLDRQRQIDVGMDSFRWVHSGKLHFRPEHKARDGKIYRWSSSVARNDPPGLKPFCGCKAQGVLTKNKGDEDFSDFFA